MAIPYRSLPKAAAASHVAYLHVLWEAQLSRYFAGLIVTDGKGQPVEFVHNSADAPSGFLWPNGEVKRVAVQSLSHSLFDGCGKSPILLIAPGSIGPPAFCSDELAPSIPFVLIGASEDARELDVSWVGSPPPPGTAANTLFEELKRRNLLWEPFSRLERALAEVYPEIKRSE